MDLALDLCGHSERSLEVPEISRGSVSVHHRFGESVDLTEASPSPVRKRVATLRYIVWGQIVYISWMTVMQGFRGNGYAKLLLNHALDSFYEQGCREVQLFCYPVDPNKKGFERLYSLYERYGFKPLPDNRPSEGVARYLCRT